MTRVNEHHGSKRETKKHVRIIDRLPEYIIQNSGQSYAALQQLQVQ